MKHYTESQKEYETALALRRTLHFEGENLKFAGGEDQDKIIVLGVIETFKEVEIKFRIAKCHYENLQFKEAASVLQAIPQKQRLPKINFLLTKVLSDGNETKTAHKEVLRKCPFAFECIESLLTLGVKGNEVQSLIINAISDHSSFEWVNSYIRGVSEIYNGRKYADAIITLASIDCMKTNPRVLAMIGISFYYSGDYDRAYSYLKKSYDLYPFMKEGIQKYALLCDMFKKTRELEGILRPSSVSPYHYTSENWFVMATYLYSCLKFEKAQYFITRVIELHQNKNVDALILNAKILHGNKKSLEALRSLRDALKYEPHRFEAHRWTIEILLTTEKVN
jgi:anaphase-promoting complex subunit 7